MASVRPEFLAYQRLLPSLIRDHDGEFVVINGERPVYFDADYEQALTWAFEHSETGNVFVKRIASDAAELHFTREIGP